MEDKGSTRKGRNRLGGEGGVRGRVEIGKEGRRGKRKSNEGMEVGGNRK